MIPEADPFGTAKVVERVLAGWAAAPERFREDANAEEDLAHGGYRDRVLVELAQNAADAAARAGVAGRLLLRLSDGGSCGPGDPDALDSEGSAGVLVAANTGAGLDEAGVTALATLRASAKRPDDDGRVASVGRFGVGFSAVLAVTDCPTVLSRTGGVRFSRADTRALVEQASSASPGLRTELDRRGGHVPVLRLPFAAHGEPPQGYDSAVLLPLRDGAARDLVEHLLGQLDDGLLLALPALHEVLVESPGSPPRRLADVRQRWHRLARSGVHPAAALADRPTEERQRPAWSVTWAVPRTQSPIPLPVVHAPTPTDEPLAWPAMLIATFPLDPTRRHVADGPASRALVARAAEAYTDLLVERAAAGDDVLPLLPAGLPGGRLDADLREALWPRLPGAPVLRAVEDGVPIRPRDAVALEAGPWAADPDVLGALAPVLAGLVAAPRAGDAALARLGVQRLGLTELVEQLPEQPDAASWLRLYMALAPLADDLTAREALAALPVPLRDGRVVRGPRGALLVTRAVPADAVDVLARLGTRVVDTAVAGDTDAARLLERLGARPVGALGLLESPEVRRAVADAADDGEPASSSPVETAELAAAVLALVASVVDGGTCPDAGFPWLADLPLPDEDGDLVPASLLAQPGSPAAELFDSEAAGRLAPGAFTRWNPAVWSAVGVADTLVPSGWQDVDTADPPDDLADMDGAVEWLENLGPGTVAEVVAVGNLDLVAAGRWPQAMATIAADRRLRAALVEPAVVVRPGGGSTHVTGYTAWWLRRELHLAGCSHPAADTLLATLLPAAPQWMAALDPAIGAALGLVRSWSDLDVDGWTRVLIASTELAEPPPVTALLAMWSALAAGPQRLADDLPGRLWALVGGLPRLVPARDAVVVDAPMWLQRPDVGAAVVVPPSAAERLADLLDLDLASERSPGRVDSAGTLGDVPGSVRNLLPGTPARWHEHDRLVVDGVPVDWWVGSSGTGTTVHAATLAGLARALAQATGRWDLRLVVEAVLTSPDDAPAMVLEHAMTAQPRLGTEPSSLFGTMEPYQEAV